MRNSQTLHLEWDGEHSGRSSLRKWCLSWKGQRTGKDTIYLQTMVNDYFNLLNSDISFCFIKWKFQILPKICAEALNLCSFKPNLEERYVNRWKIQITEEYTKNGFVLLKSLSTHTERITVVCHIELPGLSFDHLAQLLFESNLF